MRVNLDYQRPEEQVKENSNQELTRDYLEFAIQQKYPQMQGQKLRIFARLQRKLDDAVENNKDHVEFEEAEKDLIKEAFKEPQFPAKLSKYVAILWDEVDSFDSKGVRGNDDKNTAMQAAAIPKPATQKHVAEANKQSQNVGE